MEALPTYLVTAALVALYGWSRFNTPKTNRASTTRSQFYATGIAYVAACLAVYLLISRFIAGNPGALTLLGVAPDLATKFGALSAPLLAALLMTTLLPNVPALQRVDASLLAFFQRMGSIPEAVRDLSKRILTAKLTINEERFSGDIDNLLDLPEEVSKELRRDDAAGQPIRLPLTRVIAMFLCLKRWQDLPRYGGFFAEAGEKFKDLAKKFAELAEEARVAFAIIQIAPGATAQDAPAVAEYQHVLASYFKAHVDGVRRELCDLMAAALLAGERSNRDINNRLVEAGFVLSDEKPSRLDVNRVVSIVIAVFGIFLVGGAAIGSYLHLDMQVPQVIAVSLLIAAVYGAAIVCAVLPKQFWEFADIDKVGRRPVLAYVVSALLALVAAGSISLCYNMVLDWDIDAGLADFARRSPWLTMSFVSAGGLAFLCDDFAPTGREPRWLRWVEAAGGSAVLMLSGWLVCQWLGSTPGLRPTDVPDVRVVLPIDCVIGFLLAGTIPHWYRSVAVARPTPPVVAAVAGLVSG